MRDQISKTLANSRLIYGPANTPRTALSGLVTSGGALMGFPVPMWTFSVIATVEGVGTVKTLRTAGSRRTILARRYLVGGAAAIWSVVAGIGSLATTASSTARPATTQSTTIRTQIGFVTNSLQSVGTRLVDEHLRRRVQPVRSDNPCQADAKGWAMTPIATTATVAMPTAQEARLPMSGRGSAAASK